MANETTTTSLDTLIPKIIREAQYQAQQRSIMRNLVKNYNVPFSTGNTVNVPKWPIVVATDLTEAVDMTPTEIVTTEAVLTVSERGVQAVLTDLAQRISTNDAVVGVSTVLGRALATKQDKDIIALFDGFNESVGANGAATIALLEEAITLLEIQGLDREELVIVLHPKVIYDINSNLTNVFTNPNAGVKQDEFMTRGFTQMINGVPLFKSANIEDTVGSSKGAVYHRDALGFALLKDMEIEPERDASLRAWELNGTSTYGVGEVWDEYGVELFFTSSLG